MKDTKYEMCRRTSKIMTVEVDLIKKHIDKHKQHNHILTDDDAIIDFVDKFAWIMREAVCALCDDQECALRKDSSEPLSDMPDVALYAMIHKCESDEELTEIEFGIIKRHIRDHKWYNNISTYSEAIVDFLGKYEWVIKELREARSKIS